MAQAGKKLDLNSCSVDDIANVEGMNRKTAQQIIDHRDRMNGFSDWDDVRQIPGVGNNLMQKLRNASTLGKDR